MNKNAIDTLGKKLGNAALSLLIQNYPEVRRVGTEELDAACAAMRAKARSTVDELLTAAESAPGVSHIAFQSAALGLAHEGIRALKTERK